MEPESYTTQEVIEALQSVGIAEEVIEYVVPILGYESREDGVAFTRNAKDELSDSWGIAQAHIAKNAMAPAVYRAMVELGVKIPRVSKEQDKQLMSNIAPETGSDRRYFTPTQRTVVVDWFKETASVDDQMLVFKYMVEQKIQEGAEDELVAIDLLYPLTVSKFNDPSNIDAQEFKQLIESEMNVETTPPPVEQDIEIGEPGEPTTVVEEEEDTDRGVPMPSSTPDGRVINQETGRYTGEEILPHSGRIVSGQHAAKYLHTLDRLTRFDEPEEIEMKTPIEKASVLLDDAISFLRGDR